ncbi:MAG TPA: OmpA family protein [Allosphingosinicella sp.]|nr:OmpA family protein [Allosphingosinicella sp.]
MSRSFILLAAALASPAIATGPPGIWFASDSASLRPADHGIHDNAAAWLRSVGAPSVCITAGADRSGSRGYNLRLSRTRGEAVRRELVRRGIPASSIVVRAYGEDRTMSGLPDGVADDMDRYAMVFAGPNGCPSG